MTNKEFYDAIGEDYNTILGRFGMDKLITKYLNKFINEPSYNNLMTAIETGDISASFTAAHTLKGVAINIGFSKLSEAASNLTEQLRPQTDKADSELVTIVDGEYSKIITILKQYIVENQ